MPAERKPVEEVLDIDSEIDDREPTTEELVEMLRESIEDVKAGRTRPAREFLRELREILAENDHPSRDNEGF